MGRSETKWEEGYEEEKRRKGRRKKETTSKEDEEMTRKEEERDKMINTTREKDVKHDKERGRKG